MLLITKRNLVWNELYTLTLKERIFVKKITIDSDTRNKEKLRRSNSSSLKYYIFQLRIFSFLRWQRDILGEIKFYAYETTSNEISKGF